MSLSTFTRRTLLASLFAVAAGALVPAYAADFKSDRISVTTEGEGSDVILIPGLNSSPRVWREMVRAVPGHRYHLVQVSGFAGQAKGGNTEGAVAAPVAEEIARYIAASGLKKPAVIGHSMGGTIGLMLAARHPDLPSKLMVVDMFPSSARCSGRRAQRRTASSRWPIRCWCRCARRIRRRGKRARRRPSTA